MTSGTPARLRKDAEQNVGRILAAAREVFGERGLDASLDDVARHAGLGIATVYRRFPDKQHLVDVLFADRLDEIANLADQALAEPDPWQGFVDFCWHAAELYAVDRGLHDALLSGSSGKSNVETARQRVHPLCEQLVARAQASRQLRADFSATDLPLLQVMIGVSSDFTHTVAPESWRRCLQMFLDGLRATSVPPTPLVTPALDYASLETAIQRWKPGKRGL
jgi:AcrR family transcriptional regulator